MKFFKHIVTAGYKSTYDFVWMAEQRTRLGRALVYFFLLFFFVVLAVGYSFARELPSLALRYWSDVTSSAPELVVSVQNGTLSVDGLEQPYRHIFDSEDNGDSMLVYVDTVSTSSVSIDEARGDVTESIPTLVVTSKLIKVYDEHLDVVQTEYIEHFPAFSLTKDQVGERIRSLSDAIIPWFLLLGVFVVTFVLGAWKLSYLAILAWLVYVVARADKKPFTYWQIVTIGLYAITVPTLIQGISILIGQQIPFLYSVLLLFFLFGAVYKGMGKKSLPTDTIDPPKEKE
ncbi:MAG: hypothetical protein COU32_02100 [Candidatus Magasanikbacteria bacterium CG10_big_fil_rev_8_21_14_0_10_42_10]|uniref:DUF1189 domain-containing protein n=2 Tax=Candidatus Magasanikiibacteriota TaxID=1752731 RepID=A0A2H0TYJ0_9BACT|nr:MAG: hypothetical protein COU32_02100 [Candidatus Magasanikbacteria bacterium CG10_big_fil_rev_8_21_14_0_10_42_10]PIZ92530.1 MAG: hypothetical protein COX82_04610 [Candidatus Magasanikbacteria bacterium CG_4_10_14_0_2_um_filter_41_10]